MIPQELRDRPQWVVWRREERDGKPTKVPYRPDAPRVRADTTKSGTWGGYEQALAVPDVDGIGFTFAADDPFTGVDLDSCIDKDTGELHPAAAEVIERLGGYVERSPSGTGVHVIVRGELRGERNRTGKTAWGGVFEVYDRGRYFTMTGNGSGALADRQEQLDEIIAEMFPPPSPPSPPRPANGHAPDDQELLRRAFAASNGQKIEALYNGDTSMHDGDDSAADQALCSLLAFWTGPDPGRIDGLFRGSKLFREKWNRSDYSTRTISRAIERCREFYDWSARGHANSNGRPGATQYELTFEKKGNTQKLVLPPVPAADDPAGQAAWLTCAFALDRAHPIIKGDLVGRAGAQARVVLHRAGADEIIFEPAAKLNNPNRLIEALSWQEIPSDDAVPPLKGDHCRLIVQVVRMLCRISGRLTDRQETEMIIGRFLQSAEPVDGFTTHGTSAQRYEAALALRHAIDELTGRQDHRNRYLIDTETGELVIAVGDLGNAARDYLGSSLERGFLDGRMQTLGWQRVRLDGHSLPGRSGRQGPHARLNVYRGYLGERSES